MLTFELVEELKTAKDEIFDNFKEILENIEMVQDTFKVKFVNKNISVLIRRFFLGE